MSNAMYYIPINEWESISVLPREWGIWKDGWQFFKRLDLLDTTSVARDNQPVEVDVEFHPSQVKNPVKEPGKGN